jgi:signal transduction histidine kinase
MALTAESSAYNAVETMRGLVLVILLIYLIGTTVLAATIPSVLLTALNAQEVRREAVADRIAIALRHTNLEDAARVQRSTAELRAVYGASIRVTRQPQGISVRETNRVKVRPAGAFLVFIEFPPEDNAEIRRLVRNIVAAAIPASVGGLVLLARSIYDFTIMLQASLRSRSAAGASHPLMETLESSLGAMKDREMELVRLHDRERERANELAAISATLVRSLTSGFIAFDEEGRIVDLNLAAREMVETVHDAAGLRPFEALSPSVFATVLQEAVERRDSLQRVEITEESGRTVGLTTVQLLDDSGRHFGMLALFADLTHVRELEARLRETQSLADLGEMSAGIAHELRNSLSTILGYLTLARKSTDPLRTLQSIDKAERESRDLAAAVEALLVFARPMSLERQPVDLADLVSGVAERLRALDAAVTVSIDAHPVVILADGALLSRAIENLLRNAYEAIAERKGGGRIDITVRGGPARVIIADDGVGFDAAMAARMFLPFQSGKSNGFGVGLSLTRKIVLLHGGSVSVTARPEGGAVAAIELPD